MIPNYIQKEFKKIINREKISSNPNPFRKRAYKSFLKEGLPSKKLENWKHTNLSILNKYNLKVPDIQNRLKNNIDISRYGFQSFNTIVIYNGRYEKELSAIPDGVNIESNIESTKHNDLRLIQPNKTSFDYLNTALMGDSISITISESTQVIQPLRILFISSGSEKIMVCPRIYLNMKKSSYLTLLEQHVGDCKEYLLNETNMISIDCNAKLDHIRIQNNSKATVNICNVHVKQGNDSFYSFNQFCLGSLLSRINLYVELRGKGADCSLSGLSLSNNEQHQDAFIETNHLDAHCTSSQNFKFVLKDKSSGSFIGRSIVQEKAYKTNSQQSNKNLLLSEHSIMNSDPQLEIFTDDVKCSHGSSTGALENDALFYIRSRGISEESAKKLLIRGFSAEIFDTLNNDLIQGRVLKDLDSWLEQGIK